MFPTANADRLGHVTPLRRPRSADDPHATSESGSSLPTDETRPGTFVRPFSDDFTVEQPPQSTPIPDGQPGLCLVEIHGESVRRRIDLTRPRYVVGRMDPSDIVIRSPSVSRNHARLELTATGYEVIDGDSTNGTWVNDHRVDRTHLRHNDVVMFGGTAFRFISADDVETAVAEVLSRIAFTDGLTQAANRVAFEEALRAQGGREASVVVLRLAQFRRLETRYRALAMERVLSLLAGILKQRTRHSDIVARVDPHTFALLLDEGDARVAQRKADQLRRHVAQSTFRYHDTQIPVTLEAGVACGVANARNLDGANLLAAALGQLPEEAPFAGEHLSG
jgi:diguanylate cyclase (GGDEF)-like protein